MPVTTSRELLAIDLRTYGEDEVARRIGTLPEEQMERIFDRADDYLYDDENATPSGASPLLAWALSKAAVEVVEGNPRDLRWKRRKLKGVWPDA